MAETELSEPRRRSVQCASARGLHRIAYLEWGDPRNRDVLVCVHGLTRSAHDFDELARSVASHFRIACPDLAGRGDSDRLSDPALYNVPQYVADMVTLIARLDTESVNWLGTSVGGLIGMALAAQGGTPVKKLILNDVGPVISRVALERIGSYVGNAPVFSSLEEAERYVRSISTPFGPHSDAQWRFLTENWVRKEADGRWRPRYDPRIAQPFAAITEEGLGSMARLRFALTTTHSKKAVILNEALTKATIAPPAPFQGKGTYRAAPDGTTTWTGPAVTRRGCSGWDFRRG